MKIGIVPTLHGYSAVVLPPYLGDWELSTPVELQHDMLLQLRGQILHKLAIYCHDLSEWKGQLPLALLWAASGIACLALSGLIQYGIKYILLYMWVRFFFFGDGIWLLSRYISHWKGLRDAKKIREKIVQGQWEFTDTIMPKRDWPGENRELSEREYIDLMSIFIECKPYYDEMLRTEEPWIFSAAPLGVGGIVKFLLKGVKIPRPLLIFELGELK